MKITRLLALTGLFSIAALLGGCLNIPYGMKQEAENSDWTGDVERGFQPTNLPYWDSYAAGWNNGNEAWDHFFENIRRGYRKERDRVNQP